MPNETPYLLPIATFVTLWVLLYLFLRLRRLTEYLEDRY